MHDAAVEAESSDQTSNLGDQGPHNKLGQQSSAQEDATTDKTLQVATATMDNAKYDDGLDTATNTSDLEQVVPKSISTTIQHCDKFNVLGLVKHIRSEIQKLPRDTTPLAIGQELTAARDVVMGQNVQMSEPTPAPAPTPTPAPALRLRPHLHPHLRQEWSKATSPATKMEVTRKSTAWSTQAQGA